MLASGGSIATVDGSSNRTSVLGFSRCDQGVALIPAKSSGDHLSATGLLVSDLAVVVPLSVPTMYEFEDLWYPRNIASSHLVPIFPSGLCLGPLPGNL